MFPLFISYFLSDSFDFLIRGVIVYHKSHFFFFFFFHALLANTVPSKVHEFCLVYQPAKKEPRGPTPACLPACLTRVISSLTTFLQNPQTKGATTEIMSKIFSQFSLVGSKSGPANIFSITTPVLSLTSDSDFWIVEPITQPTQVAEVIAVICGHVPVLYMW